MYHYLQAQVVHYGHFWKFFKKIGLYLCPNRSVFCVLQSAGTSDLRSFIVCDPEIEAVNTMKPRQLQESCKTQDQAGQVLGLS